MDFRNAQYNADKTVDCEVNDPRRGWMPFTASIDDPSPEGRRLYADIITSDEVAAYVAPPPPTYDELVAQWRAVAFCQMLSLQDHLIDVGLFDQAETASQSLDPKWRIRWGARGGVVVERVHPLLDQFANMIGLTPEQVDEMPIWQPPKPGVEA